MANDIEPTGASDGESDDRREKHADGDTAKTHDADSDSPFETKQARSKWSGLVSSCAEIIPCPWASRASSASLGPAYPGPICRASNCPGGVSVFGLSPSSGFARREVGMLVVGRFLLRVDGRLRDHPAHSPAASHGFVYSRSQRHITVPSSAASKMRSDR